MEIQMKNNTNDGILSNDPVIADMLLKAEKVKTKPDDPSILWTPYVIPPLGVDGIGAMLRAAKQPVNWILENLLEEGDQLLIGGAPKTGKSLCALQIALAVASGGAFLEWQAPKPRRVLYVNLEIKKRVLGVRILKMVGGEDKIHKYNNLYCMNVGGRIDITDPAQAQKFINVILALDVDLIVWDVLARMHNKDEMTTEMLEVMDHICRASLGRANIVVHHTRKPPVDNTAPQTAHDLRGSGAIFGECDGAFVLSRRKGAGAAFVVTTAMRAGKAPDEMFLDRDDDTLMFVDPSARDASSLAYKLGEIFGSETVINSTGELIEGLKEAYNIEQRQASKYLKNAVEVGFVRPTKNGRSVQYHITLLAQRVIKNVA